MKIRVLVDLRVVCDPPNMSWYGNLENQAKALERWAKDFNAFMRDHRSQDDVTLSVERVYENQCSHCGYTWEMDDQGPVCCQEAQQEWDAEKQNPQPAQSSPAA